MYLSIYVYVYVYVYIYIYIYTVITPFKSLHRAHDSGELFPTSTTSKDFISNLAMMAGTLREWSFEWRQDHKTIRTKKWWNFPSSRV